MNILCDTNIILDVLLITCASTNATSFSKKIASIAEKIYTTPRDCFITTSLDFIREKNYNNDIEEGFQWRQRVF